MIKQPEKSKLCGHCCIATILDIPLEDAILAIGHEGVTEVEELIQFFPNEGEVEGISGEEYSLCYMMGESKKTGKIYYHWVITKEDRIYDPSLGYWKNRFVYTDKYPNREIIKHIPIRWDLLEDN